MKFYVLENMSFTSSYAYGEKGEPVHRGDPDYCPVCGSPMTWKRWLPPKSVILEKPKYGDFVYGTFDSFLVSENFKLKYENSGLKGIINFDEVKIHKVRRLRRNSDNLPPKYYHVEIKISATKVDEKRSNFIWDDPPSCDYCRSGTLRSRDGFIIDEFTWTGEDIFYCQGYWGTVVVNERFKEFLQENQFTNYKLIPDREYRIDWTDPFKR